MEKSKRNRTLIWIAIILLLANLSIVSSVWINGKLKHRAYSNGERSQNSKHGGFEQRMAKELNLNANQIETLNELKAEHRKKMIPLRNAIKQKKSLILEELIKEIPDTNYINNVADSIGILNASFEKLNYTHLYELKSQLNNEQLVNFNHVLKSLSPDKEYHRKGKNREER